MAMIEIEGLVKRFGSFAAVDGVSFAVERGTVLGFLGPNGAGKSTTMKMITGFLPPTAGRVSVCGFDIAAQGLEAKRRIGLGITGIAGPGGGTEEKPVGLVYIAVTNGQKHEVVERRFPGDRERIRRWASQQGLDLVRKIMM